jgi:hypothetical protein
MSVTPDIVDKVLCIPLHALEVQDAKCQMT